jgi:hypothetical protein
MAARPRRSPSPSISSVLASLELGNSKLRIPDSGRVGPGDRDSAGRIGLHLHCMRRGNRGTEPTHRYLARRMRAGSNFGNRGFVIPIRSRPTSHYYDNCRWQSSRENLRRSRNSPPQDLHGVGAPRSIPDGAKRLSEMRNPTSDVAGRSLKRFMIASSTNAGVGWLGPEPEGRSPQGLRHDWGLRRLRRLDPSHPPYRNRAQTIREALY